MPSTIEWTEETWNPVVGCTKVGSPGCEHCYAIGVAHRHLSPSHVGLTVTDIPLRRRKPTVYFVNSMSDLFHPFEHEQLVDDVIFGVNEVVALCPAGHVAQRYLAGADGPVRTDHQPCLGAWWMERVGKKTAGRKLDGRTWDEYPP